MRGGTAPQIKIFEVKIFFNLRAKPAPENLKIVLYLIQPVARFYWTHKYSDTHTLINKITWF